MTPIVIALVSFAIALCLGWIFSKAYFRTQTMSALVPRKEYDDMRERYRKRLLIMHKLVKRHEATQEQIKEMLSVIQDSRGNRKAKASDAASADDTQGEISGLLNRMSERDREIADLHSQIEPLDSRLKSEFEDALAAENELHLMRIERDELLARIARQESGQKNNLNSATAESDALEEAAALRAELGAVRSELSSREHQGKELRRQLDESEAHRQELRATLDSWKQRVNPLTKKLKQQRAALRELRDKLSQPA